MGAQDIASWLTTWLEKNSIAFSLGLEFLSLLILAPLTAQVVKWRENRRWKPFRADVLARMRDADLELRSSYQKFKEDLFDLIEFNSLTPEHDYSFNEIIRSNTRDPDEKQEIKKRKEYEREEGWEYELPPIEFRGYVYPVLKNFTQLPAAPGEKVLTSSREVERNLEKLLRNIQRTFDREGFGLAPEMVPPLIHLRRSCAIFLIRVQFLEVALLELLGRYNEAGKKSDEIDLYLEDSDVNIHKLDVSSDIAFRRNDAIFPPDDYCWIFMFKKLEKDFEQVMSFGKRPRKSRFKKVWHRVVPHSYQEYRVARALTGLKFAQRNV
jgi:hypothetical protein